VFLKLKLCPNFKYYVTLTKINFKDDDNDKGKCELFVKNLSYDTSDSGLKSFFEKYGSIRRTNILKRDDGKSKGIGFVSFDNAAEAKAAMDDSDNFDLDGRKISVNWAMEKKKR